jgi:DNA-binding transcriptional LysR family regulator
MARDPSDEEPTWLVQDDTGREERVRFRPVFFSNDWLTLCKLTAAGFGVAALPFHVCRDDLASGKLERVLPGWRVDHATLTILTPSRRGRLPSVRAFIEFLVKELPPSMLPEM